jgi:AcrR family transcriptional regulator
MPRPQREQLILDFAGQVFARDGYHTASMDEIAQLAGVSKPMLYAYFDSKEGLYVAYIARTGRELVERLQRGGGGQETSTRRLRSPVSEFLKFVEEYRDGWKVLFSEVSSSRPLAEEVAQLRGQITDAVRRLVDRGVVEMTLPPGASDAIAHAIVGAGESLANWWLEHPEIAREQVAGWYAGIVEAAVAAAVRSAPGGR